MKKKIVALAVAAAFTTPAFADNANVTVYGKAFLNVERVTNDKVVAPNKDGAIRVNSDASRFGVKGSEDLGEGLKGLYQFEVEMGADGSIVAGMGKSRNSGVGIEGGFGKVILGIWDTPYKVAHNKIELFDNATVFSALNLIGRAGGNAGANYGTREAQIVQYWTPVFSGLQGAVSYKPDATPQATTGAGATGDQSRLSVSATYDLDDIYASAAYERRADVFVGTTDTAMRFVGKYHMADFWVGATVESIKVNSTATVNYTQSNMELVGQYKMGPHKVAASFAKAGKTNVAATGATQLALRYGFDFSKRTEVFAAYTSMKNDTAGTYNLGTGVAFGPNTAGATMTAMGAGIVHSF